IARPLIARGGHGQGAVQYCTASWGVLPARKAQASRKSRLSQNPQEDRAGKHGEATAGFADVEQCFEPLALRRLVRSLTGRFLLCQLAQPSTASSASRRAARRFASIS